MLLIGISSGGDGAALLRGNLLVPLGSSYRTDLSAARSLENKLVDAV